MLATSGPPFDDAGYIFEVKWDGVRALTAVTRKARRTWAGSGVSHLQVLINRFTFWTGALSDFGFGRHQVFFKVFPSIFLISIRATRGTHRFEAAKQPDFRERFLQPFDRSLEFRGPLSDALFQVVHVRRHLNGHQQFPFLKGLEHVTEGA
jgi:hypothetical protein